MVQSKATAMGAAKDGPVGPQPRNFVWPCNLLPLQTPSLQKTTVLASAQMMCQLSSGALLHWLHW